ncbi:DotI/IcmL/TraM family protein [Acetobacter sp. UBA5411]|uniref:DotI/IcmL/TraM family protein n=1 Tax=Acetobacter sp. UBA5411 TaxID=1945905 RepID=UPI0025C6D0E7|nr:DotI/IcmL/TraM family protein [Acetobacter sp. UBA5411]
MIVNTNTEQNEIRRSSSFPYGVCKRARLAAFISLIICSSATAQTPDKASFQQAGGKAEQPMTDIEHAALTPYTLDYIHVSDQMTAAGQHFTRSGWNAFVDTFIRDGNISSIQKGKLACEVRDVRKGPESRNGFQLTFAQKCLATDHWSERRFQMNAKIIRGADGRQLISELTVRDVS